MFHWDHTNLTGPLYIFPQGFMHALLLYKGESLPTWLILLYSANLTW